MNFEDVEFKACDANQREPRDSNYYIDVTQYEQQQ